MITFSKRLALATLAVLCLAAAAQAGEGQRNFAQYSGFEGNEQMLGAAVAETIMGVSPTGFTPASNTGHDFSDSQRQKRLGHAVSTAIKTINSDQPYMHEMNDALVKMTLTYIQFAKDQDLLDELIQNEIRTQSPMLTRVGKLIKKTGNQELALLAITDRTACFYQLVEDAQREPGTISYRSPYGNVLTQSSAIGQHDLTEKEIHEIWTVPRIKGQAELMGVDIEVSEWRDDGIVTISVPQVTMAATTDKIQ
ncbi:MAG: hypothetical protein OER85_03185 [Gammaproteobacteria bacterium]|nr:hypothetical protein [Gammaproteobacteria bacterium]